MKYVLMMSVLALFAGKLAIADDSAEMKKEDTATTSENPVTGTVTTKHKQVRKHKDMAGNMHSKTTKSKMKHKTDGSTTTSTETEEKHDNE